MGVDNEIAGGGVVVVEVDRGFATGAKAGVERAVTPVVEGDEGVLDAVDGSVACNRDSAVGEQSYRFAFVVVAIEIEPKHAIGVERGVEDAGIIIRGIKICSVPRRHQHHTHCRPRHSR